MPEENQETLISEEQKAAKGMEVRKGLQEKIQEWMKQQIEKKGIAHDVVRNWEKMKNVTTEGSLRHKIMDKLQPMVERGATAAEKFVKFEKTKLKIGGLICKGLAVFAPVDPASKLALGAIGLGMDVASMGTELKAQLPLKSFGLGVEAFNRIDKKRGYSFNKKIDSIIDGIFGWKPPAEKVYVAEARPAVMPKR